MRVLVVAAPLLGHVFPLVPLAQALRRAGHDVLLATGGEALKVRESGLAVEDVVPAVHMGRLALRTSLAHPLAARSELRGEGDLRFVSHLFAAIGKHMLPGVFALAERWLPDVVVHDALAGAGTVVAAHHGIPAVVHDISLFDGATLTAAVLTRMRPRTAFPEPATVLRTAPPSVVEFSGGWPMRFVPYAGDGTTPDWLRERPERPRILVSRSTVAGPGGGRMMEAVLKVAPQVDAEFVVIRPSGSLPGNVRGVDWVSLPRVLPRCAAVVHHGGAGTLLAALTAGVPQLVEPGVGDRTRHARLVTARGAGLTARASEVTSELLGRLVTDNGLARAAKEVSAEISAMPSPAKVAARFSQLAHRH
ncbi:glycosyl transferase [Lentzea sp. NBRC 105346]|uniref:nucleotide disphospho-sugar-binding domain-containing protein n=1 Tax=Lentzea sp. NBRC 105346 TaxID=3032205 RepID=UPI0024A49692|nr:nucleotide disphospho-sugar-binding domain-containing protein [Lentzea sp. NBRC 105346]GLZ33770.1 glycosyl transferase [Lentzea sp. NBRC 105346]